MIAASFTPEGLAFDPDAHGYTLAGFDLLHVTGLLADAGLVDRSFFTIAARKLGTHVHHAIERYHASGCTTTEHDPESRTYNPVVAPYLRAHRRFLADTAFVCDAVEERLADRQLRVAGTLDLRGRFLDAQTGAIDRVDVIDVKTGTTPPWVAYQLAGYARLLPPDVRGKCRRWSLALRADGSYRLLQHASPTDERVFLAAVVIASAKRGWL